MRITLTLEELTTISKIADTPIPDGVNEITYTVNNNLTVAKTNTTISIMRGSTNPKNPDYNGIYVPGTK